MDIKEEFIETLDELRSKSITNPDYYPEQMDYVALSSFIREEKEGYDLLKVEFRVPKYFKFSSDLDIQELIVEMRKKADLFKKVSLAIGSLESVQGENVK